MFKFYEVGGCVRDEIMGVKSKDIDYTVVYTRDNFEQINKPSPDGAFTLLERHLTEQGYHIWLSTPSCFTIRAKFPDNHPHKGITADFVLARKEMGYVPGTRQPIVFLGTLHDDLERRDFTVNAIAKDEEGNYIDPFGGITAIKQRLLTTPLAVEVTFDDDPLRILRAIRFSITKNFMMTTGMRKKIETYDYKNKMQVVSEERIREELFKAFKHDSLKTMAMLCDFVKLARYIFDDTKLWLKPTNEQ
jgi:tRNA nucleotidyltransferase/poly(A) polymerase